MVEKVLGEVVDKGKGETVFLNLSLNSFDFGHGVNFSIS